MASKKLSLLDESDSDNDGGMKINREYASTYKRWKEKESLKQLEKKYGDEDMSGVSSSDSEVEDDNAEEVTPSIEKGFLAALSALKSQDPKIYKNDINFYPPEESGEHNVGKAEGKKTKPMFLKDYDRKVILEKGGKYSDEEDEDEEKKPFEEMPYSAQQHQLKQSFKVAEDADAAEDLFKVKEKTETEQQKEEDDYIAWMKGKKKSVGNLKEGAEDLKYLHDYWNDPALDDGEKFLRDYILDRKYRNDDDEQDEKLIDSSSDDDLEKQEAFERKYNFRFEEPDPEFIKSYPRTIEQSLRRKDDKRKEQRDMHKRNQEEAKQKKKEELKLLKKLKRNEILEKIDRLKEATGNTELSIKPEDIDGDFDPVEYDEKMKEVFADGYYGEAEDEKPKFSDSDDDAVDNPADWDEWEPTTSAKVKAEGQGESDKPEESEAASSSLRSRDQQGRRKRKRKHLLTESLEREKPVFDPNEKTFEEYLDEYYKLDCEDVVADMPVRFKYRKVVPNDFGLSTEEILAAPDPELNAWVSVKRMSQYRREEDEKYDLMAYQQKAADQFKKKKVLKTLYEKSDEPAAVDSSDLPAVVAVVKEESTEPGETEKGKTRRRRRKKQNGTEAAVTVQPLKEGSSVNGNDTKVVDAGEKNQKQKNPVEILPVASANTNADYVKSEQLSGDQSTTVKKMKKKKFVSGTQRPQTNLTSFVDQISDERLWAYGVNPKKLRNKVKYGGKQ